ncbi:MAG TPA: hypothetical protein VGJ60_11060 [Chloroflexota bacterium]
MAIPLSPPTTLGEPLTHWSLRRLKAYLERRRVVSHIAAETLRCILREKNVTFQRTRTWKRSTDPAFEEKTTRIMALYRTCPSDGVVVCFDEFGPISLQPYPGHCYAQQATVEAAGHIRAPRGVSATSSALTTCLDGRSQGRAGRNTDIDQSPQSHRVPLPTFARIVLNASDYASHGEVALAFRRYLHRRNTDHQHSRIRLIESRSRVA